jgi:hypothetical protein
VSFRPRYNESAGIGKRASRFSSGSDARAESEVSRAERLTFDTRNTRSLNKPVLYQTNWTRYSRACLGVALSRLSLVLAARLNEKAGQRWPTSAEHVRRPQGTDLKSLASVNSSFGCEMVRSKSALQRATFPRVSGPCSNDTRVSRVHRRSKSKCRIPSTYVFRSTKCSIRARPLLLSTALCRPNRKFLFSCHPFIFLLLWQISQRFTRSCPVRFCQYDSRYFRHFTQSKNFCKQAVAL